MGENEALAECARAIITRHGKDAAEVARFFADANRALGEEEMAAFWTAIAEMALRMLASGKDGHEAPQARRMQAEE